MTAFSTTRAGVGIVHLVFPDLFTSWLMGGPLGTSERRVVRFLGARQLAQALGSGRRPTSAVLSLGAEVDIAHGTTMIALALLDSRYRRLALAEAFIAACFAINGTRGAWKASGLASHLTTSEGATRRDEWADRLARRVVPGYVIVSGGASRSTTGRNLSITRGRGPLSNTTLDSMFGSSGSQGSLLFSQCL